MSVQNTPQINALFARFLHTLQSLPKPSSQSDLDALSNAYTTVGQDNLTTEKEVLKREKMIGMLRTEAKRSEDESRFVARADRLV